jgi:hypothetical protein
MAKNEIVPRWAKAFACVFLLTAITFLALFHYTYRLHGVPMKMRGISLKCIQSQWVREGRPWPIEITNYIGVSTDHYFVHTNIYRIGTKELASLFGVESSMFRNEGFLTITRDGTLVWVDAKGGPEIVNP